MKESTDERPVLWSRPYTLTVIGSLFLFIPYALFLPVLPVYVLEKLNGSLQTAGLVNAVFLLASVLCRAQTTRLEARFGKRRTLLVSSLLYLVSNCLYFFATTSAMLMAVRLFGGVFFAIVNTSITSLGSSLTPRVRLGEGMGYLTTMVTAGIAIGPFAGLSLARSFGYPAVFAFAVLTTVVGLLIILAIRIPAAATPSGSLGRFSFRDCYQVTALPVATVLLLIAFAYSGIVSFVTVYAKELQLFFAAAWFFVVLSIFSILSRLVTGRVYDRFGADAVIYPSIFLLSAGLALLGTAQSTLALLLAAALVGLAYGIAVPSIQSLAVQKSSPHRISAVTATVFTFLDLGMGAGAYLIGAGIPLLGHARVYLLLTPLMLCTALLYHYVQGRR